MRTSPIAARERPDIFRQRRGRIRSGWGLSPSGPLKSPRRMVNGRCLGFGSLTPLVSQVSSKIGSRVPSLSIQFHALPDEFEALSDGLRNDTSVHMFVGHRYIGFSLDGPTPELSAYDFRISNPDALVWEMGEISDSGLAESWVSAKTDNEAAMKRWRRAATALRKATSSGAIAKHPLSGAQAPMRWHRFTAGAQRAFADGLAMRPAAGKSIILLPPDN